MLRCCVAEMLAEAAVLNTANNTCSQSLLVFVFSGCMKAGRNYSAKFLWEYCHYPAESIFCCGVMITVISI